MNTGVSRRTFIVLASFGVIGIGLAACGGGEAAQSSAPAGPAPGSAGEVSLEIGTVGNDALFDKERLEVPAGSKVTLVFNNNAAPEAQKLYNWVLTRPNTLLKVVNDGLTEGGEANSYVKPNDENVIAFTKLIPGGASDTITFDAPPVGEYTFASTSPGLYARMRGTFVVK